MSKLKTSSHYVKTLLGVAERMGMTADVLMAEAGISQQQLNGDNMWLDNSSLTVMVKALWRESGDETLGIDPQPTRMGTWALACDYMIAAETLGELYRRGEHIYSFLPPESMGITLATDDQNVTVEILAYTGERDPQRFLMEFVSIVWHRFACWAVDEYFPLKQVSFSYPEPSHHWFYEELFQAPVLFDQAFCGFSFGNKQLNNPVCRSAKELAVWLRESPADLLYMPGRDNTITHHVKKQLAKELREHMRFPAFDAVCESLIMSNQVVRRRLDEEATSYQRIKDTVRLELIKELLVNPDHSIADITERSGFAEAASLSRAFKKWTGITPAQYRDQKTSNS